MLDYERITDKSDEKKKEEKKLKKYNRGWKMGHIKVKTTAKGNKEVIMKIKK